MANLYTPNGSLHSLYDPVGDCHAVRVGQPLGVRYLYFFLRHARGRQQLMISTYAKSTEEKSAAAEAINYYNPVARFNDEKEFRLADFGGRHYGHPLCYYTPSYLGESLRLTTRIAELDRVDRRVVAALRRGLALAGTLPAFAEYVVYTSLLQAGAGAAERVINFFDRDDNIVESHSLDLHSGNTAARHLRTGRIVCIPGADEAEFLACEAWQLSRDNRLVDASTGREYTRGSYFVLEVRSEENPAYEKFDYYQGVAELLRRTNRGEHPGEILELGVEMMKGWRDYRLLERLERLALEPRNDAVREQLGAAFRLLTPRMQRLYADRMRAMAPSP